MIELELEQAGEAVELRPDLGIGHNDVRVVSDAVELTVHSLGHVATPPGIAILEDARGRELARTAVWPLPAPTDLVAKSAIVRLPLSSGAARVTVMLEGDQPEVTRLNNRVDVPFNR